MTTTSRRTVSRPCKVAPHASLAWGAFLLLVLTSCATPIAPTGGPDDTTPPALTGTLPLADAVRVTEREITLEFSERLNPQSTRAITVVPEGETPPEVRVRANEVRITLDSLREATTYVVTVSTDLRDARGVALRQPLTLAFATGDELDRGRIMGRVLTPEQGEAASGLAVWAYRADSSEALPDPRRQPPDYSTQSGPDGAFALEYLREGTYFVVSVEDGNRNRRADPGERFAAPPRARIATDTLRQNGGGLALYTTVRDTLAPESQRARGLSDRRLAVRFSEPVMLQDVSPESWSLADSATGLAVPLRAVYVDAVSPQEVRLESLRPLASVSYLLALTRAGAVADSSGNQAEPFSRAITPPARPDSARTRLAAFLPEGGAAPDSALTLRADQRPGVRFTLPPDSAQVAAVMVSASGNAAPFTLHRMGDGRSLEFEIPREVRRFSLSIPVADSVQTRAYRRLAPNETGELAGRVTGSEGPVLVQAFPSRGAPYQTTASPDGAFRFPALPPGDYRLRFVSDTDANGTWTGGSLAPYLRPERVAFADQPQTVRARFETDMGEVRLAEE